MSVIPGVFYDGPSPVPLSPFCVNPWTGPLSFGGNLWTGVVARVGLTNTFGWYKSSNSGAAWALQDSAHAPALQNPFSVAYPWSGGSKWYFATLNTGAATLQVDIYPFDMSTGLWGALFTSVLDGAISVPPTPTDGVLVPLRSGSTSFAYFYRSTFGGTAKIYAQTFDGATWSGPFTCAALQGVGFSIVSIAVDAADRCHLFVADSTDLHHVIFSAGSFGASDIASSNANDADTFYNAVYKTDTDEIVFGYTDFNAAPNDFKVLRGSPSSAPVWSEQPIDASGSFDIADGCILISPDRQKRRRRRTAGPDTDANTSTPQIVPGALPISVPTPNRKSP